MAEFNIRPAVEADFPLIKKLVNDSHINPLGLNWNRFLIAEINGQFAGCGQIKPHFDGTMELASIATVPEMRGHGISSAIIRNLIRNASRPIYLICRGPLGVFYEKFGFRVLDMHELPEYYRRLNLLAGFLNKTRLVQESMLVMKLD